jgi:hypothetical protein
VVSVHTVVQGTTPKRDGLFRTDFGAVVRRTSMLFLRKCTAVLAACLGLPLLNVQAEPCIDVTKLIACRSLSDQCGTFDKTASGISGDAQIPSFCYQITVTNCGSVALTNVTVIDDISLGELPERKAAGVRNCPLWGGIRQPQVHSLARLRILPTQLQVVSPSYLSARFPLPFSALLSGRGSGQF